MTTGVGVLVATVGGKAAGRKVHRTFRGPWMRKALDRRIFMSGPKIPTVIVATALSPPGIGSGTKAVQ